MKKRELLYYLRDIRCVLCVICIVLLSGCHTTKHIVMDRAVSSQQVLNIDERTDKNTIRFITITEYADRVDSVSGEQPVSKVTTIKEVNNDVITTQSKQESNTEIQEHTQESTEKKPLWKTYAICFVAGIVFTLLVILIIKLIRYKLRRIV